MIEINPIKQLNSALCGPACIQAILKYYSVDLSQEDIARMCDWSYDEGCFDEGMVKAIKSVGFEAEVHNNCEWTELEYCVRNKIPAMVDWWSSDQTDQGNGHESIVVDISPEKIKLMDPWDGKYVEIERYNFERNWFDFRHKYISADPKNLIVRQLIAVYPKRLSL